MSDESIRDNHDGADTPALPKLAEMFEPIPGVTMAGLRGLIIGARKDPATAEATISGLRAMIASQGHSPDQIIADAMDGIPIETPEAGQDGLVGAFVDFHDRRIAVKTPSVEQIVVIRRLQKRFTDAAAETAMTAERAVALMSRALTAITSIVVEQDDKDYIEDLWLDGEIDMTETLPLLTTALNSLKDANKDQQNRASRRAADRERSQTGSAELLIN